MEYGQQCKILGCLKMVQKILDNTIEVGDKVITHQWWWLPTFTQTHSKFEKRSCHFSGSHLDGFSTLQAHKLLEYSLHFDFSTTVLIMFTNLFYLDSDICTLVIMLIFPVISFTQLPSKQHSQVGNPRTKKMESYWDNYRAKWIFVHCHV